MKAVILHECRGRMRLHIPGRPLTLEEADLLEFYLNQQDGVTTATVHERTGNFIVCYTASRQAVLAAIAVFRFDDAKLKAQMPACSGRALNRTYQEQLFSLIFFKLARKMFLPVPLQTAYTVVQSLRFIGKGLQCLWQRKLNIEVLDAVSIFVSLARRDAATASSVMFLLNVGEILEEWTYKKSINDLAKSMSLQIDRVWLKQEDTEVLVPIGQVAVDDCICVHTGHLVPLDGIVVSGEAMVNQASLTGESLPVRKQAGAYVYAGTVLEEGECTIRVTQQSGSGKYDKIVAMIEASEQLKSSAERNAARLADRLVPYSLGATALTYLLTRNVTKALSILMVDFSCALKLAMPLTVLSAMREAGTHKMTVKGGKYLEAVAKADTIVFDKTGTLTHATPTVADVIAFNGEEPQEMLRLAACLEEHYPHSMANAIVQQAAAQQLSHAEMHSQIEYIVAHGISSIVDAQKVVIGSHHFVFEDEGCRIPEGEEAAFAALPEEYSHLYMAKDGVLSAVFCIMDPMREEAPAVIAQLRQLGIKKIVMMTGDSERAAQAIARKVGVDACYAEVLPEDKAAFVKREREQGRTVIMIGDGINDSPALSAANVGIAISDGAALAREIADITISADNLHELVVLKTLSNQLLTRIAGNYNMVIGFNAALIALGVMGVLPPASSALLHNLSTIGISLHSMTDLLDNAQFAAEPEQSNDLPVKKCIA